MRILGNALLLVVSVTVALLALEVGLRLLGMLDPILYRADPVFGYEPRPNQSATRLGVPIFIDDVGLRDDENDSTLRQSRNRILVLGNSVTYGGSRIHQRDLFTEVVERELRVQGRDVKLLNAGVNGYSVSQALARGRRLLDATRPTALVLFAPRADFLRPPVQLIPPGGSIIYPTHRPVSALVDFLQLSLMHIDSRHPFLPAGLRRRMVPPPNTSPPYDTAHIVDIHLAAFEDFLRTAWERAGHSRHDIVVFLSPTRDDVANRHPDPNVDLVQRFAALGVRAFDLARDYEAAITAPGQRVQDYYFDDVHYLEPGHALAGRLVAQTLLQAGIPPP